MIFSFAENRLLQIAVRIGTNTAVTITQVATSAVADWATGAKAGFIWAMIIGLATAAPAVEEAASLADPLAAELFQEVAPEEAGDI